MWCAFKKHDRKVVVASSMELKAKDVRVCVCVFYVCVNSHLVSFFVGEPG